MIRNTIIPIILSLVVPVSACQGEDTGDDMVTTFSDSSGSSESESSTTEPCGDTDTGVDHNLVISCCGCWDPHNVEPYCVQPGEDPELWAECELWIEMVSNTSWEVCEAYPNGIIDCPDCPP